MSVRTTRLRAADVDPAKRLFALMVEVFGEEPVELSDAYLRRLLSDEDFWVIAAFSADDIVGGITAHTLPMTRSESSEVFIYDLAVRADHQRQGVGRQLMSELRAQAAERGIGSLFVAADNADTHALDFYRAVNGTAAPVTMFSFE
jgi:aminoglycoside 3-N-acetyltransferase I